MTNNLNLYNMSKLKGTPKTGGRQAGTPNKTTSTVRSWIVELINNNREQIEKDIQQLEPKDRLNMLDKLLPYILPKVVNANEVEGAVFTKEDIEPENVWKVSEPKLSQWYEK